MQYPRLPELPAGPAGEPLAALGVRALRHAIEHGHAGIATLDDHALAMADHFYPLAIAGASPATADACAEARRLILAAIRRRQAADSLPEITQDETPQPAPPAAGGYRVKVPPPAPRPIVPQLCADPF